MGKESLGDKDSYNQINTTDISDLANNPKWTGSLSYEDPADKKHRLEQEAANNWHKRWRGTTFFYGTVLAIAVAFGIAAKIVTDQNAPEQDKRWAAALMTSVITGFVGYATGKATS